MLCILESANSYKALSIAQTAASAETGRPFESVVKISTVTISPGPYVSRSDLRTVFIFLDAFDTDRLALSLSIFFIPNEETLTCIS
ncbi:MAG: hypothetical protein ACD_67C00082G0001, partial [uncultured bacterium]